uniref:Uncharacterized protein n=2 Tax=Rhodosorus marinus TaxID=101924 RepID=A0A7S0G5G5_9RHOD|mmetsp:Transcript_20944/g.30446  ORF Transcript_20944/g.30446 Transcript_20944/m.30446 type:complete len:712 (+) Transcript_20944:139-2274(+)
MGIFPSVVLIAAVLAAGQIALAQENLPGPMTEFNVELDSSGISGGLIPNVPHYPQAITVDSAGDVFVTGYSESDGSDPNNSSLCGKKDGFVAKIAKSFLSLYIPFGTEEDDVGLALTIDVNTNTIFSTGYTEGGRPAICTPQATVSEPVEEITPVFDITATPSPEPEIHDRDWFILRASSGAVSESTRVFPLLQEGDDEGLTITTDGKGTAVFLGGRMSSGFNQQANTSLFIVKYTSELAFEWSYPDPSAQASYQSFMDRVEKLVFDPQADILYGACSVFPSNGQNGGTSDLLIVALRSSAALLWEMLLPKQTAGANLATNALSIDPDGYLFVNYVEKEESGRSTSYLTKLGSAEVLLSTRRALSGTLFERTFGMSATQGRRIQYLSYVEYRENPTDAESESEEAWQDIVTVGSSFGSSENLGVSPLTSEPTELEFIDAQYHEVGGEWVLLRENPLAVPQTPTATIPSETPSPESTEFQMAQTAVPNPADPSPTTVPMPSPTSEPVLPNAESRRIVWASFKFLPSPLTPPTGRNITIRFDTSVSEFERELNKTTNGLRQALQDATQSFSLEDVTVSLEREDELLEGLVDIACVGCDQDPEREQTVLGIMKQSTEARIGGKIEAKVSFTNAQIILHDETISSDTPTPTPTPGLPIAPEDDEISTNTAAVIAISVTLGTLALIMIVLIFVVWRRRRRPPAIYQDIGGEVSAPV